MTAPGIVGLIGVGPQTAQHAPRATGIAHDPEEGLHIAGGGRLLDDVGIVAAGRPGGGVGHRPTRRPAGTDGRGGRGRAAISHAGEVALPHRDRTRSADPENLQPDPARRLSRPAGRHDVEGFARIYPVPIDIGPDSLALEELGPHRGRRRRWRKRAAAFTRRAERGQGRDRKPTAGELEKRPPAYRNGRLQRRRRRKKNDGPLVMPK